MRSFFVAQEIIDVHSLENIYRFIESYENENPAQTQDELRIGSTLDYLAQHNKLGKIHRVKGRKRSNLLNQRNPDYSFQDRTGIEIYTADLYQPLTSNPTSIESSLIKKSGQANIGIIEPALGNNISLEQLSQVALNVLQTTGHTIRHVILIHGDNVLNYYGVNASRSVWSFINPPATRLSAPPQ